MVTTMKLPTGALLRVHRTRTWVRVELDRDQLVDRLTHRRLPWHVPACILQATEQANTAGVHSIWLTTGARSAFYSGQGDRWRVLHVPTEHETAAVAAMVISDISSDIELMKELTKALAPPYDDWLRPGSGPRYLEAGLDFHCSPRCAAMVLRIAARERGVKARARPVRRAVRIDPQLIPAPTRTKGIRP